MTLPPFSGVSSMCIKCGTRSGSIHFCDGLWSTRSSLSHRVSCPKGEHIHRQCVACGYEWLEHPLDWREPEVR